MAKVFRVTCEFEFFVRAEDEDDAWSVARRTYSEAIRDADEPDIITSEVSDIKTVPKEWRQGYPYANRGEPEETIEQMLETSV